MPDPRITRFAPSPTGELHLGHVAHALAVWETAEALAGKVIVGMEDHDRTRCRPAYEASILHDIAWLGFRPDAESLRSLESHSSPYRQSGVEQAMIETHGLAKNGGTLLNKVNSIAPSNPAYGQQVSRGFDILRRINDK